MKVMDLIAAAKAADGDAFKQVTDAQAAKVLSAVFKQIRAQVDATGEGPLSIGGLGQFLVRHVQPKADAAVSKPASTRRVLFFPMAKPGAKSALPNAAQ